MKNIVCILLLFVSNLGADEILPLPKRKKEFVAADHTKKYPLYHFNRVSLALSCADCEGIPKVPNAGEIVYEDGEAYQVMFNGLKVPYDCYCPSPFHWQADVIHYLRGHHEPQEERVFYEVLPYIPAGATMIELGSNWAYYSMWFQKEIEGATNYMIEPSPVYLEVGRKNFELNGMEGHFYQGYVGAITEKSLEAGEHIIHLGKFIEERGIERVHLLHSDIQGAEESMLHSIQKLLQKGRVDFLFISTHGNGIHERCIKILKAHRYQIIASHNLDESYSCDGLIAAKRRGVEGPGAIQISKRGK